MSGAGARLERTDVVVTGGTGFLGSAFVRRALQEGARVTLVSRHNSSHWRLRDYEGRYSVLTAALSDLADVQLPTGEGRLMVHFAAAGVDQTFDDVATLAGVNVSGTASALEFAARSGVTRFVLLGSSGEYGPGTELRESSALNPTSEYGATRAAATLLARAFARRRNLDVVILRPFAVYGPYEPAYRLIPYCILSGLRGEPIRISSGVQTRDYVHVDDVADAVVRACVTESVSGEIFNVCTGIETTVRATAELIAELTGGRSVVETGARADIPGEMWRTSGDASRARDRLSWRSCMSLRDGLAQTIEWFRRQGADLPEYRSVARV